MALLSTMENIKKGSVYFIMLLLSTLMYANSYTTGPSYISSKINPISVNDKGEILCRTRFTKNELGAQKAMKITYGYCVITSEGIMEYTTQELEPDGYPDYETFSKHTGYWNNIFNSALDINNLSEIGHSIIKQYHFKLSNVVSYKVDKEVAIETFERDKNISLTKSLQLALNGAKSTEYFDNNTLHIMYDFGNVILLKNKNNEPENLSVGADFDYQNPLSILNDESTNMGFDSIDITGVLVTSLIDISSH